MTKIDLYNIVVEKHSSYIMYSAINKIGKFLHLQFVEDGIIYGEKGDLWQFINHTIEDSRIMDVSIQQHDGLEEDLNLDFSGDQDL